ncbi:hypothetical protein [Demequina maris]|uniref:hypothetical protein n=1 Tax=Demequina maris TaxID=1638982 RepID=UPI00078202AE|nr:hypothetical protein [Demequina maris]
MAVDRITAFRRQYRRRSEGSGAAGVAYAIYVGLLVVLIYGGPALRNLAGQLHRAEVLDALLAPAVARGLGVALGAAVTAAFALGTVRGPAITRPFLVYALATSDISRRRAFGRTVLGASLALVGGAAVLAAVLLVPVADAGAMSVPALLLALAAAAMLGGLVAVAWLAGQAAHGATVWAVPLALAAATAVGALVPAPGVLPWTWAAAAWPAEVGGASPAGGLPLALLAVATLAAGAAAPLLMAHLRGPELIQQARRWEVATVAATTGDLATAIASMRAAPVVGRRWRMVRGRSFVLATLAADLVAPARSPMRALGALVALVAGAWGLALAPSLPGLLAGVASTASALLLYAGLGPWADGLTHAVLAISSPRLFGVSDGRLVLTRALAPVLGGVAVACPVAVAASRADGEWWIAPAVAAAIVVALVVVRLDAAAKGAPPLFLSAPIVTPMGDLSVVGMVVWQLDAAILAALAGLAALGLAHGSTGATVGLAVLAGWALLQWRLRLRKR